MTPNIAEMGPAEAPEHWVLRDKGLAEGYTTVLSVGGTGPIFRGQTGDVAEKRTLSTSLPWSVYYLPGTALNTFCIILPLVCIGTFSTSQGWEWQRCQRNRRS